MVTEPAVIVRHDGTISYANEAAERLFADQEQSTVVGTSIFTSLIPSYHAKLEDQLRRIYRDEAEAIGLTLEVTTTGDRTREFVTLQTAIEWDGDRQIQMQYFPTRGKLPEGLTARTLDESPVGVSIADATREDEPLIYVNDEFCDLTGYPREAALGRNCRFLQGERTDDETVKTIRQAIDSHQPITIDIRNYRNDGSLFWNRLSITPIEDDTGTVTHFLGFQQDVSDEKRYEREKALFEMQAESTEQTIFITDTEGRIEYVNPAFERTTGYTMEEALGENPRILKSDQHEGEFYQEMWETITAGEVWETQLTNRRKSGELYRTTQKIVPITDQQDQITNFLAIEEDITDAQFIEQVLHVMDRVMRHNVRNSVTTIRGFAELLESDLEDEAQLSALKTIQDQATKLQKLSDETRTIRELFHRRHVQHSLDVEAIAGFVEARRELHPEARITLSMEVPPETVVQNGSLLQLAIDEALENAIIHSDQAEPHVDVSVTVADDDTTVCLEIADTGPGIPDDQWNVIMAGKETPLAHSTGVGLWLMYWTITALGGVMDRTENDPRGTILTFRVPLATGQQTEGWSTEPQNS